MMVSRFGKHLQLPSLRISGGVTTVDGRKPAFSTLSQERAPRPVIQGT